jgi:hypothetical protein
MSMSDEPKRPVDILVYGDKFRALYADGTLSRLLTIDEMMDVLPLLDAKKKLPAFYCD